jgi:HAD superfamily hydrolase (TIGR01509 family)
MKHWTAGGPAVGCPRDRPALAPADNGRVVRGLVFDFDGLIVDSERPVYRAWAEVYERFGEHLSLDLWKTVIGHGPHAFDPVAELGRRLGRDLDAEALRAQYRARQLELMAAEEVLPGVREWRDEAAAMGVRLGVASNSRLAWVGGNLERLGLDGWDCIRTFDDVDRAKPEPDVYLAVVACLGLAPPEVVAVEDSSSGVASAKAAGLFCVAVPGPLTADADYSAADLVLGSLADRTFAEVAALAAR